jgi:excisionase family DNA binding protein
VTTDLTPEEVAEILGLHRESVYRLLRAGVIPGYKAGLRQWRTPRTELESYKRTGGTRGVTRRSKKE